ncbi:MAG: hypothetical protein JO141_26075 [Bradyrhizobium sp.]|nr:hypothetical protein [Bradyrhizobium sp.]
MSQTENPEPTEEQAALFARVRRMMLVASLTTALAISAVLVAVGYRLFKSEGSAQATSNNAASDDATSNDVTAPLPQGSRVTSTAISGDRLVVTLDIGGATEIRIFDAKTLKPAGRLKFTTVP